MAITTEQKALPILGFVPIYYSNLLVYLSLMITSTLDYYIEAILDVVDTIL